MITTTAGFAMSPTLHYNALLSGQNFMFRTGCREVVDDGLNNPSTVHSPM